VPAFLLIAFHHSLYVHLDSVEFELVESSFQLLMNPTRNMLLVVYSASSYDDDFIAHSLAAEAADLLLLVRKVEIFVVNDRRPDVFC
jgi:hypothetical protein